MTEEGQYPWWEEGCYCPSGRCVCGTSEDPFGTEKGENDGRQ